MAAGHAGSERNFARRNGHRIRLFAGADTGAERERLGQPRPVDRVTRSKWAYANV